MQLPKQNGLPINLIAACFNSTVATYKFYWFLSILQSIESGETKISKKDLFARMISNAWFTVNYFHISFGKQDKLQRAIEVVKDFEPITIDDNREKIFKILSNSARKNTLSQLNHFNSQVPHWFLSPWVPQKNKSEIYNESKGFINKCLNALFDDEIIINPA